MATQLSFNEFFSRAGSPLRFQDGGSFYVESFSDGIMVIETYDTICSVAKNIAVCFNKGFNDLKAIKFKSYETYITITAKDATPEKIVQIWEEKWEEKNKAYEEYKKTPEYRAQRAKELKDEYRQQKIEKLVKYAAQTEELQFKDEEARKVWDNFVEAQPKDDYGVNIIRYAEYWAKFMQYLMAKHEGVTVAKIASNASRDANIVGASGAMYHRAINILSRVWKHGEAFRKLYNKKYC